MGSKEPLVSIGVPTFNRAASLQKCLASIMAQTYANIELIVSDNASTDETPDVIADYQNRDPRVRAFRQPVNCEGVPNFRFVREKAEGRYYMMLGDDDWIDPELIESCVRFLEKYPDHVAAGGRTCYYREGKLSFDGVLHSIQKTTPRERILETISKLVDGGSFHALFRREIVQKIPFLEAWGCDYYYLCEAAYYGKLVTLRDVACHRNDNSYQESIQARLTRGGIVDGQGRDPYGTIASVMFWRFAANAMSYSELTYLDMLQTAAAVVETVGSRWTITGEANLLELAIQILEDLHVEAAYRLARRQIMSAWLTGTEWNEVVPILDAFIKMGYSGVKADVSEKELFSQLTKTAATIADPMKKEQAVKILSLFF